MTEGFSVSQLPEGFKSRMKEALGDEYEDFIASYDGEYDYGLRVNTLKASKEIIPFELSPVPWALDGYYYNPEDRPGKSPLHEAGAYYMQEPSAMLVAAASQVTPGMRVLDLCAAPGGKSTALAALLGGEGLLVANEISQTRAAVLSQNMERLGIRNAIVVSAAPSELSPRFPFFFDRIIVDAPCSGEGMFRKEPDAIKMWSLENINLCAARQKDILAEAVKMLAPGGKLVYSTCTFAKEEDEDNVSWLIKTYPELKESSVTRLWPHKVKGEGHFCAVFEKTGIAPSHENAGYPFLKKEPKADKLAVSGWHEFSCELGIELKGNLISFGENLYLTPANIDLAGLKVLRDGLQLGSAKKGRFEPSHALALALLPREVSCAADLSIEEAASFIAGNELALPNAKNGWCLVSVSGVSLGWVKVSAGRGKNHYPKGLRRM